MLSFVFSKIGFRRSTWNVNNLDEYLEGKGNCSPSVITREVVSVTETKFYGHLTNPVSSINPLVKGDTFSFY